MYTGGGGMLHRASSLVLNKNRIRNRYWGRREASERIYISFEYEWNKECVLGEEGGSRKDFY